MNDEEMKQLEVQELHEEILLAETQELDYLRNLVNEIEKE